MKYRLMGRTGLLVSEICLGTMTFGGRGFWKQIGQLDERQAWLPQQKIAMGVIISGR